MSQENKKSSPTTYVALLRGINVGGNNKIEMARLKQTFERLGLSAVRTFIASGNVIFSTEESDPAQLAETIEAGIKAEFGLPIKILLRDQKSMRKLVKAIPAEWTNDKQMRCDVMFLAKEVDNRGVLKQLPHNPAIEDVKYVPGTVIWRTDRDQVMKSRMPRIIGTPLYRQMTIRNLNTVRKLYALMSET